ncbi:MAG: RND family transporter, partial [Halanaerobium sp. MSAO_Bac5]
FYSNKRISIIITALIIIIVSIMGLNRIVIDTPLIEMFKENSQIRQADDFINKNFAGTTIMNVMIEGEDVGSLNHPQILKPMADLQNYMSSSFAEVGKMSSIADYIKRMNQVMHYPDEEIAEEERNDQQGVDDGASFYNQEDGVDNNDNASFYQENDEGDTGSFYEESESQSDESSFYEAEPEAEEALEREIMPGPDKDQNLSEYDFMMLLNRALARADRLDITADELVNLLNQEMNFQAANYYEIPHDLEKYGAQREENLQNLISQYLLLYSGSLDDMINDDLEPDKAQILVQLNDPSTIVAGEVREAILNYTEDNFPDGYQTTVSGNAVMAQAANDLIVSSQTRSILISFIVVFLIVAYSFKSLIAGIYGIVPLAFALLINFGLMGYSGIKLDVGTAMVASIAIGIGVDYTIHFLHSYHKERQKSDDLFLVTQNTLTSTGKAIIFNAISVAAGFLVLLFSNFYPLVYLGLLIAVTMFSSSIAALTILPLMLNIFKPKFIQKEV